MGRPSQWKRPTKMMRFPEEFEEQLSKIAHKLDNGEVLNFESEPQDFDSKLEEAISDILKTVPPSKRGSVARLFNRLKGAIGR